MDKDTKVKRTYSLAIETVEKLAKMSINEDRKMSKIIDRLVANAVSS